MSPMLQIAHTLDRMFEWAGQGNLWLPSSSRSGYCRTTEVKVSYLHRAIAVYSANANGNLWNDEIFHFTCIQRESVLRAITWNKSLNLSPAAPWLFYHPDKSLHGKTNITDPNIKRRSVVSRICNEMCSRCGFYKISQHARLCDCWF